MKIKSDLAHYQNFEEPSMSDPCPQCGYLNPGGATQCEKGEDAAQEHAATQQQHGNAYKNHD
jgi:hypothetical protein